MRGVIAAAKKRLSPSVAEEKKKSAIAEHVLDSVRRAASGDRRVRGAELGGSFAKGTWLAGGADIDVFVVFDTSVGEKELESASRKIGFSSLAAHRPYVRYASHPYVEAVVRGTKVNVVPCYDVESGKWKSAVDRSRFHTAFMKKSLSTSQRGDVRVLKRLLKSNGLYGAELAREAFSGYVCEVLVHSYGTLAGAVRALASAERGLVIGRSSIEPTTSIAIMDPVDDRRNLAAAVSEQNMGRLSMLCRYFERRPSSSVIFTAPRARPSPEVLKRTLVIGFDASPRSPEVIWGQAKSAASALASGLGSGGFGVFGHGAHVTESMRVRLAFVLESMSVPRWSARTGPEYFGAANVSKFVAKNAAPSPLVWVGADSRLRALRARGHERAADLLRELLGPGLARSGVPAGLRRDIRAGFTVRAGIRPAERATIAALSDLVSTNPRTLG